MSEPKMDPLEKLAEVEKLMQQDFELAGASCDELLDHIERCPVDASLKVRAVCLKAMILYNTGQLAEALDFCNQYKELAESISDETSIGTALFLLGNIYREIGALERALECTLEAKGIFVRLDNKRRIADCIMVLGGLYADVEENDLALEQLMLELKMRNDAGLGIEFYRAQENVGAQLIALGRFQEALEYLDRAVNLAESAAYTSQLPMTLAFRSHANRQLGRTEQAICDASEALRLLNGKGSAVYRLNALMAMAKAQHTTGNQALALEYGNQALAICKTHNLSRSQPEVLEFLSIVNEQLGESSLALQYERQAAQMLLDESRQRAHKQLAVLELSRQLQESREANASLKSQEQRLKDALIDSQTAQRSLRHKAEHDELTGLLNRRGLESWFETHLTTGKQYEICFLDLDHFKDINDSFGHASGDDILVQVGKLIQDLADQGCTGARVGGDEFVLIFGSESYPCNAYVDEFKQGLLSYALCRYETEVTATSGVIRFMCGEPDATLQELMKRADSSMYREKPSRKTSPPDSLGAEGTNFS
ncbi:MAG: diguanylate cyclase domain-containing protein [Fimbriimonadaceae bacterium]